jgi:LIVCS family branched-chain amino acid:cation transporter
MHDLNLSETSRTDFLIQTSVVALGNLGSHLIGVLFALACFTTAVGIITGTADFVKELSNNSENAFRIAAGLGSMLGVLMGQLAVSDIIDIAFPVLQLVYPLTIVLIGLHVLPEKWTSPITFRVVVLAVILASIPEFLGAIGLDIKRIPGWEYVPLQQFNLGWVIPVLVSYLVVEVVRRIR